MTRFIGALLKQFGPTSGGGETCINPPTLVFSDNGNGTGGVATISGASGGTTNTVWVSPYSAAGLVFTNDGQRSGNGTVSLTLGAGTYIGYVSSTDGTCVSDSPPIVFTVTAVPTGRSAGGSPVLATKNPFQPMSWAKTPQGDLIGVNGIERGILWDGYATSAYNLGISPPDVAPVITQNANTGGAVAGAYNFYYRYVDFAGRYSTLSPATTLSANDSDAFAWQVVASDETNRADAIELWRTVSGGSNRVYFIASLGNTTQSHTDSLSDQTLLNNAISDPTSTMLLVNDDGTFDALRFIPPPTNKAVVVWFQQRAFYCADVLYTTGLADVVNESTTVVGLNTDWPTTFIGRYFYGENAPRGYLIDSVNTNAPNVFITVPGGPPADAVQTITLPGATCGTWTWTLDGHTTGALAYNAPATGAGSVQSAITGLSNVGSGNAAVTLSGMTYTVTFQGALTDTAIDTGTADGTNLCGLPATVTRLVAGNAGGGGGTPAQDCIQVIGFATVLAGQCVADIQGADGGEFFFTFNGHSTAPIAVHPDPSFPNAGPTAAQMQAIAQGLASIGLNNVTVIDLAANGAIGGVCGAPLDADSFYGTGVMGWQFTFQGALAGESLPQMTITVTPTSLSTGVKAPTCTLTPGCQIQAIQCTTQQGSGGTGGGGGAAANEVQEIFLPMGTTGGTFTLTTNGHTTGAISWNASALDVQTALNSATGGSNFSVTGGNGGPWIITFQGAYAASSQALITVNTTSLTGGTIATATTTVGGPGEDCVQTLVLGNPTAGTYTLGFNGHTTAPIAYNAAVATVQSDFTGLASVGTGNCVVASPSTGILTFTFQGALADAAQPLIVADLSGLTGAAVVQTLTLDTPYLGATASNQTYTIRPAPEERNQIYFCVDEATEVLTKRGWLTLDEVSTEDEALAVDPVTKQIRWSKVKAVNVFAFDGELNRWKSRQFDALTTDDHRWLAHGCGVNGGHWTLRKGTGKNLHFVSTAKAQAMFSKRLFLGGGLPVIQDEPLYDDDFVELCAWYITEGTKTNLPGTLKLYQSESANPEKSQRIRELCARQVAWGCSVGEHHTDYIAAGETRTMNHFTIGADLARPVKAMCPNKELTPELLLLLSTPQLRLLYETLLDGDGHRRKDSGTPIFTQRKTLPLTTDAFQMLCAMLGYSTGCHEGTTGCLNTTAYRNGTRNPCNMKRTRERYVGRVWCPTTAEGTWMARRNGFTYWTGNSESNEGESVPNGDPAVPDSNPNTANSIKCQQFTERDDEIVGAFAHGPFLYFLQSNHLILFDYNDNPKIDGEFSLIAQRGAFNNRCRGTIDDVAFLMDREGAYILESGIIKPISDAVQNYWRDSLMDFTKASTFFVSVDVMQKVARFHYCKPGDSYPQQALCFSLSLNAWWPESYHEPMGASTVYPIEGRWRALLGGQSGLVHVTAQGHADVVDTTTETGTLAGTVTASTTNTLTDSSATFRDTMIGAPVTIIQGTAKGQTNYVLSHTGTQFTFTGNWGVTPAVGDLYRVGAIAWGYTTGDLPLLVQPVAGDEEQPQELARGTRISWEPTEHQAFMDIQHTFDHNPDPVSYYVDTDDGNGLTIQVGANAGTQEMTLGLVSIDGMQRKARGYTRFQWDSGGSDFSITRRFVTVELAGYQCQDGIRVYALNVMGVTE